MKAAVCNTRQFGPSVVFLVPQQDSAVPAYAAIPGLPEGILQRALGQWAAKGSGVPWEEWADVLARSLPYFEQWTVTEVPGNPSAAQALSFVRKDYASRTLGPEQQPSRELAA
jgi:hypothetical protein